MREDLRVGDDGTEFSRRYLLDPQERAGSRSEEHLILDDVADAGEDRLVEQHIRDLGVREGAGLLQSRSRTPLPRHDIGGEVVLAPCVTALDPFHRCRPDCDFTVREVHHQAWRACTAIVARDRLALHRRRECAPQHEMDAHRERVELEYEMFAPGEDVLDVFAAKTVDADPAIAADTGDFAPDERPQLIGRQMDGRTFHAGVACKVCAPPIIHYTSPWVIYVGTAGWNIPRAHKERFSTAGSQLERYASRLNGAEINSSFYRSHAPATYERWAASVPATFRFAVKIPKIISHERLLARSRDPLTRFLDETSALGSKRGPLLLQLPPSFAFDARRAGRFFELFRQLYTGPTVCEPRHSTWATAASNQLLVKFEIARVAADPPRAPGLCDPAGWTRLIYYRWHGSPRAYFSCYTSGDLVRLAEALRRTTAERWCIFDNTGSGSAAGNALDLAIHLTNGEPEARQRPPEDRRGMARRSHSRAVSGSAPARNRKSRNQPVE